MLRSADDRLFVGPDNGLLVPAAEACGGIRLAVELTNRAYMLDQVSHTFHGRDVFSPVAGHLAGGLDPLELGPEVDAATLVRPQLLGFERDGTVLGAIVQRIDRFGNVQLSAGRDAVADVWAGGVAEVEALDDRYLAVCADTFADVQRGELVLYEDSEQRLSIAINRGDAAELLDLTAGSPVRIEFAPTIDA